MTRDAGVRRKSRTVGRSGLADVSTELPDGPLGDFLRRLGADGRAHLDEKGFQGSDLVELWNLSGVVSLEAQLRALSRGDVKAFRAAAEGLRHLRLQTVQLDLWPFGARTASLGLRLRDSGLTLPQVAEMLEGLADRSELLSRAIPKRRGRPRDVAQTEVRLAWRRIAKRRTGRTENELGAAVFNALFRANEDAATFAIRCSEARRTLQELP